MQVVDIIRELVTYEVDRTGDFCGAVAGNVAENVWPFGQGRG